MIYFQKNFKLLNPLSCNFKVKICKKKDSEDCDFASVSPPTSEAKDYSKAYRDHHIHSIYVDHIQNAFHDHQKESEQLRGFQV